MSNQYRKPLPGTDLDFHDAREAVDRLQAGAWDRLPYTSRVYAENIVRRADPAQRDAFLGQLIERRRDLDFPWFPARVVCHDILGQTALVDLAGLRDAIAQAGGDPAQVNPVVPVQLIVDHSLAVECGGFDPDAFGKLVYGDEDASSPMAGLGDKLAGDGERQSDIQLGTGGKFDAESGYVSDDFKNGSYSDSGVSSDDLGGSPGQHYFVQIYFPVVKSSQPVVHRDTIH